MKHITIVNLRLLVLVSIAAIAYGVVAAHSNPNVVLVDGTETWEFVAPKGSVRAVVKNTVELTYEATRYGEKIQPAVFYNDIVKLNKAAGKGKPRYESAPSRNVFHDDNRVCYFDIDLEGPGKKKKVSFERTVTDPAFFTMLHLCDLYYTKHKQIRIIIPPEYSHITLEELNFSSDNNPDIKRSVEVYHDGTRVHIYEVSNLDGSINALDEYRTPNPLLYRPVILVKGWFQTLNDLCRWHADMSRVDTEIHDIDTFLKQNVYECSREALTQREKIERIYAWVQQNIRYVAYEEGESGHRPDRPAEVLRKRYGDCKGMALLLSSLLQHEGIDAHAAVIGTNNIPFPISGTPSLAATDHSICVAVENGDTLYLDATNIHIPVTHIPSTIQGKDAIVLPQESEGECSIINVPRLTPSATATDSVCYNYTLSTDLSSLIGMATRTLGGDFKEAYISRYYEKGEKYVDENMAIDLVPLRSSHIPIESVSKLLNSPTGNAVIEAAIENSEAVTQTATAVYVDFNANNGISLDRIDNHDRQSPYRLPSRGRIVRQAILNLPPGMKVTHLPENFSVSTPNGTFSCLFSTTDTHIVTMSKVLEITNTMILAEDIDNWNKALSQWENAAKNQIELHVTD